MSNLQTLLDAAKFVESTNTPDSGARAPDPPEFHHYAKTAPSRKRSNSGSDRSDHNEDGKDQKRYGGSGTREVHNILEKNRRAHLKECFDGLKMQIPNLENHNKVSNLSILRGAFKYIQMLKRTEKELEQELQHLSQIKSLTQERINSLQKDLCDMNITVDVSNFLTPLDEDTRSVSTATAHNSNPIMSDDEDPILDSGNKGDAKPSSKQLLSFCNVIMTTAMSSTSLSSENGIQTATTIARPLFVSPVFRKGLLTNSQQPNNTVGNNRTIAAMLSAPGPTAVLNGITTKKNTTVTAVAGITATTETTALQHPVSLFRNITSSSVSANNTKNLPEATTTLGLQPQQKNSVTQLLQQTITQRVQLQQLVKQQQQQLAKLQQQQIKQPTIMVATTVGTTPANINVSQLSGTVPQVITVNTNALQPVGSSVKNVAQLHQAVALNHVLPSTFTLNTATPLVTSAADATAAVTTTVNSEPITIATLTKSSSSQNTVAAATMANQLNVQSSPNVSLASIGGLRALNIKPILTIPITQLPTPPLASQQITTLQQLMSQAVAKSNTFQHVGVSVSTPSATTSTSAASVGMSHVPAVAPTAITPLPVTQYLPISIVTPASGQATGLGQVNLTNAAFSSQVLKNLGHISLLQQPVNLPIKPLVMVTVANPVTSTETIATPATQTIQISVPITHS